MDGERAESRPLLNKTKSILLGFFILGFILRIISAKNIGVAADDVNHAIRPIGIFGSGKLVIFDQSTALWYYIQAVFYKFFGVSQLGSRFASVMFGSFLIILVFMFTKKIFKSEKSALIASFLVAISPILIKSSMPEMDITASFFTMLSAYFLFDYLDKKENKGLFLAAFFIGIGIMIKLYVAFFAVSFFVLVAYKEFKSEKKANKSIKKLAIFSAIIFILVLPTLAHNYLLYRDKGFMDLIFTNVIGLGQDKAEQFYAWNAGWKAKGDYIGFFFGNQANFDPTPLPGGFIVLGFLLRGDPLLFALGILGLIYSFNRNKKYFWFFLISFVPIFVYLGAQIPLAKHFVWGLVLAAPMAGEFSNRVLLEKIKRLRLRHLLIVFLIINMLYLGMPKGVVHSHFYGESSFGQAIDYKNDFIGDNSLVVADSRIYRGNIHWAFYGTNYIEASEINGIINQVNQLGEVQNIEVYYFECVIDDCGWGTVAGQPEFNQSMELTTQAFKEIAYFSKDFSGPRQYSYYLPFGEKETSYRVYKTELALNPAIIPLVKRYHTWFLYPVGYDRSIAPIFDDYQVSGVLDNIIYFMAWTVFYFELVISLLAMIYIGWLFLKD